jgi:hypothetical protein
MRRINLFYLTALTALLTGIAFSYIGATTRYVDLNSTDPFSPYITPETAATNIQDAINVSTSGDEILVAAGTYLINNTINITNGITLQGTSAPQDTVIARNDAVMTSRVFTVSNALIANLTVSNGIITNSSGSGAGIYLYQGTISNCILTQNKLITPNNAGYGGGIYIENGVIDRCAINNNGGSYNQVGYYGGGVCIRYTAIIKNSSIGTNQAGYGGAICFLSMSSNVVIDNCIITNNISTYGIIAIYGRDHVIKNCCFSNNYASGYGSAAAFYTVYPVLISNCYIFATNSFVPWGRAAFFNSVSSTGTVIDSCVIENHYDLDRAAIHLTGGGGTVRNCILYRNTKGNGNATGAGGIYIKNGVVENCTVSGNYGSTAGTQGTAGGIYAVNSYIVNTIVYSNYSGVPSATNRAADLVLIETSVVENCCFLTMTNTSAIDPAFITNSITNNPQFVSFWSGYGINATNGDMHLKQESPCINTGSNIISMQNKRDIEGKSRIDPVSQKIDMGAYEFLPKITLFVIH